MLYEFVRKRKVKGWLMGEKWNENSIYCPWNSPLTNDLPDASMGFTTEDMVKRTKMCIGLKEGS